MTYTPRTVWKINKPRANGFQSFYLYSIFGDTVFTEDGEVLPLTDFLSAELHGLPRALAITKDAPLTIKRIAEHFAGDERFNARLRLARRVRQSHRNPNHRVTTEHLEASFFGLYKYPARPRNGYTVKHHVLNPDTFLRLPKHAAPYVPNDPQSLLMFGKLLRSWCKLYDIPMGTSGINIASALLRDKRFLKAPVRKVAADTNTRARSALTGHLFWTPSGGNGCYPSLYRLDQRKSHHQCAADLDFPHPDTIYARGYFRSLWDHKFSTLRKLEGQHGLLYVRLNVTRPSPFLPALSNVGSFLTFITTNELPYLLAEGARVQYVIAAWTSPHVHTALNHYALWALADLRNTPPESLWWKKPLLLAPYGLLGAHTGTPHVIADTRPNGTDPVTWYAGQGETITVYKHPERSADNQLERPFVNVIARAMIERESQARTAQKAHELQRDGWRIVCVDADAILLKFDGNREAPESSNRWKVTRLDDAIIEGPLLVSNQIVKLPGIAGTYRERTIAKMRKRIIEQGRLEV